MLTWETVSILPVKWYKLKERKSKKSVFLFWGKNSQSLIRIFIFFNQGCFMPSLLVLEEVCFKIYKVIKCSSLYLYIYNSYAKFNVMLSHADKDNIWEKHKYKGRVIKALSPGPQIPWRVNSFLQYNSSTFGNVHSA